MRNKYEDKLNNCSKQLIIKDGNTLLNLCHETPPLVLLALVPYIALYCRSVQEFFEIQVIDEETDSLIYDLRNDVKLFSERYSISERKILSSDERQDKQFKNSFPYFNLGVYFDKNGNIVGNTQYVDSYLNIPTLEVDKGEIAYDLGMKLGKRLNFIFLNVLHRKISYSKERIIFPSYGYIDLNTNYGNVFWRNHVDKELNLIILHLVSIIGFVEQVLGSALSNQNLWFIRIEYITAHYAWKSIKKIKQHYENLPQMTNIFSEIWDEIIEEGGIFFSSSFRGCMMHYNLCDEKGAVISKEYFNLSTPFYGLVESCFKDMTYDTFIVKLRNFLLKAVAELTQWFNIDASQIKWDLESNQ